MKKTIELSLVIPTYNEEDIIKSSLEKIIKYLDKKPYLWEIIVVDDGSSDATSEIVRKFQIRKVRLIKLPENQGKGAALRKGFLDAQGKYIIFSDADLSVPITNIDKFINSLKSEADVVIASRRIKGARIEVAQQWYRELMGRFYTYLTIIILTTNLADFTCGFKGFKKKAAKDIFKRGVIDRWAYDSEILFLANKLGYTITQIPIVWKNREDTRVRLRDVIFDSFVDLLLIRFNYLLGRYNRD